MCLVCKNSNFLFLYDFHRTFSNRAGWIILSFFCRNFEKIATNIYNSNDVPASIESKRRMKNDFYEMRIISSQKPQHLNKRYVMHLFFFLNVMPNRRFSFVCLFVCSIQWMFVILNRLKGRCFKMQNVKKKYIKYGPFPSARPILSFVWIEKELRTINFCIASLPIYYFVSIFFYCTFLLSLILFN